MERRKGLGLLIEFCLLLGNWMIIILREVIKLKMIQKLMNNLMERKKRMIRILVEIPQGIRIRMERLKMGMLKMIKV